MKNDLREKLEKKVRYLAYHGTTLTTEAMVNKALGELVDIYIEAQLALLDKVMGSVIGSDFKADFIYDPNDVEAKKASYDAKVLAVEFILEKNDLLRQQRQALQAIRDSVSGGKTK